MRRPQWQPPLHKPSPTAGRTRGGRLRAVLVGLAAVSLASGLAVPPAAAASSLLVDPLPPAGMSAAEVNAMWTAYGNVGGHWTGGDRTFSVKLPDGRLVWLFSDTFLGQVNADGSRPSNAPMVHNTLVVQDGSTLGATLHGGTATTPTSLMCDDSVDLGCWVAGAIVEGANLRVLVNRYRSTGPGSLDIVPTGNALVTLSLPGLAVTEVLDLALGAGITWGQALVNEGPYTYIYGSEHSADFKFAHVARVPVGGLTGPWEFWTGTGWSSSSGASARLVSGVGTAFAVQKVGDAYLLITVEGHLTFNSAIVAYTAASPTGPFGGPIELARAPEAGDGRPLIVYDTSSHAALARAGKLLISYNVNSLDRADTIADVTVYRPRFIEVDWPRPAPDPAQLPAVPNGLTATADSEGGVHLSWNAVPGQNLSYWVYQRDVTAAQIQWVRLPQSFPITSADLGYLKDGHTYEYRVAAANAVGEGQPSGVASATVRVLPPAAPAGLTATANADGSITLAWQAAARAWYYVVTQRDITGGEAESTRINHPNATATTLTVNGLAQGHEYEFRVLGVGGAGDGAESAPARATASFAVPSAPTGLTATPQLDGTISLRWTAPPGDVWHRVYQRDVTAGETQFAMWPLPVTGGSTAVASYLTHGHEYEFKVTATNPGGESGGSNVARATASYALPAAPTNLTATPGDGQVTLTWVAPGPNVWYRVYQRDVTAGEDTFWAWPLPVAEGTTATALYLTNGHEYEFKIAATNGGGEGPASAVVRVRPLPVLPGAPTGLVATPQANGTITLSWQAPEPNVWYAVYQRDVTAGESGFTRWPYPVTAGTTALAQYLTHGHVYEFKVAATNAAGDGPATAPVRATARFDPPPAPTNLRAAAVGDGKIELNWDAPYPGLYSVIYWRDVTAGQSTFTRVEYLSAATSITMEFLTHAHTYEYKVAATNPGGEGAASSTVQATAFYSLPLPPTNLSAAAGDGRVTLNWTASPTAGAQYIVYFRDVTAGASWQRTALPLNGTSATIEFLANGHTYAFRVTASNAAGQSDPTATVNARPLPPLPQPPSALSASPGDGSVALRWTASPTPNVYYWVEYRDVTAGQAWTRATYPVVGATSITMGLLTNGHTYEYRVRANNVAGDSAPSNVVSARPMPPLPQAPTNLTATPGDDIVTLRWTASTTPNVYYWIEYRDATTGQSWIRMQYPVAGTSVVMRYLWNGHTYQFRVRATNITGVSSPSNVVSAVPWPPVPAAPLGLTVVNAGPYAARLSWNPVPGADSYTVYHVVVSIEGQWMLTEEFILSHMRALPYPVFGTTMVANDLWQHGYHWFAVAANNYPLTGPKSRGRWVLPLQQNWYYTVARAHYFDAPAGDLDSKLVTTGPAIAGDDRGIVVSRAFIADVTPYGPISDHRSYSVWPDAKARIHMAWDTGRGQIAAYAGHSCIYFICRHALPLIQQEWTGTDFDTADHNFVWRYGTASSLVLRWSATNSDTSSFPGLAAHIDAATTITFNGSSFSAYLRADHFPTYEVYHYPRYTALGEPAANLLVRCWQHNINGLYDLPIYQRNCG